MQLPGIQYEEATARKQITAFRGIDLLDSASGGDPVQSVNISSVRYRFSLREDVVGDLLYATVSTVDTDAANRSQRYTIFST